MTTLNKSKYPLIFSTLLTLFTLYVVLDTFIIPTAQTPVQAVSVSASKSETLNDEISTEYTETASPTLDESPTPDKDPTPEVSPSPEVTESVLDENSEYYCSNDDFSIAINTYREYDTEIYVAEVVLSDTDHLKTALANNTYGKNIKKKTSEIADSVNAVFAVNGDFYGTQEKGYVIRNGILYRDSAKKGQEDLVILEDGSFLIINESEITASELLEMGAVQVLSFGPGLIEKGEIAVTAEDEVGKAMASNPRTAIGITSEGHYIFVVSDGRTSKSEGLSLYELAEFMQSLGVETAYNLDGGGSSTMYFNGEVINNPTTSGSKTKERSVSDIVYIG
jgi:uncharacterized protein YigE (DUF2233 family)